MLSFVLRRIAYSIPVLIIASIMVFVFEHFTSDPLARFANNRDPNARTSAALKAGLQEGPCH
ncbi:MAG: hypothetical protein QOG64_1520, partial [Acidimicrobiaceae bacterium]|nr:hypothetical protein [Acidimicrobiaceae bacterium]